MVTRIGSEGNDTLVGTAGDDQLYGLGGIDFLRGGLGNDYLDGGDGLSDAATWSNASKGIFLNAGDAFVFEGTGGIDAIWNVESFVGSQHDDYLRGTNANNQILGLNGSDILDGNGGDDRLQPGGGNDAIYGGDGNDAIDMDAGRDVAYGGAGNDLYYMARYEVGAVLTIVDFTPGEDHLTNYSGSSDPPDAIPLPQELLDTAIITDGGSTVFTLTDFAGRGPAYVVINNHTDPSLDWFL